MEDFFAFETKTPKMKRFVTPIREMEKDFTDSPPSNPMENILIGYQNPKKKSMNSSSNKVPEKAKINKMTSNYRQCFKAPKPRQQITQVTDTIVQISTTNSQPKPDIYEEIVPEHLKPGPINISEKGSLVPNPAKQNSDISNIHKISSIDQDQGTCEEKKLPKQKVTSKPVLAFDMESGTEAMSLSELEFVVQGEGTSMAGFNPEVGHI